MIQEKHLHKLKQVQLQKFIINKAITQNAVAKKENSNKMNSKYKSNINYGDLTKNNTQITANTTKIIEMLGDNAKNKTNFHKTTQQPK